MANAGTFTTGTVSTPPLVVQSADAVRRGGDDCRHDTERYVPNSATIGSGVFAGETTYFSSFNNFNLGADSFADIGLNQLMSDGRYGGTISASLPVVAGQEYKLELLFWDPVSGYVAGNRPINITAGTDTLNNFDVIGTTGGWKGIMRGPGRSNWDWHVLSQPAAP